VKLTLTLASTFLALAVFIGLGCAQREKEGGPRVGCDLQIKKEAKPSQLLSGQHAIVTMTVTNVGSSSCPGPTTVTEKLPPGWALVSASSPGWVCKGLICTYLSPIPAGGSGSVSYTLKVAAAPPGSVIQNCALVTNPNDTNKANDQSCVAVSVIDQSSQCVPPPDGMVNWWTFDETSGTKAQDIGGVFNNVGAHVKGPTPVAGIVDGALSFDGVKDYVEVADHPELNFGSCIADAAEPMTIDLWVKTNLSATEQGSNSGLRTILDKRVTPSQEDGYSLFIYQGRLGFRMGGTNYVAPATGPNHINIADNQWHFIAVSLPMCRGVGGFLYADGQTVLNLPRGAGFLNKAKLYIGRRAPAFGANYFRGVLDELEIFKNALSDDDLRRIFEARGHGKCKCVTPPSDMVAWWPLDETAHALVADIAGNPPNNGTSMPGAINLSGPDSLQAKVNNGFLFCGAPTSKFVTVADKPALNFGTSQSFSIDAWIKTSKTPGVQIIVDKLTWLNPTAGYRFYVDNTNVLKFDIGPGASFQSTTALTPANWYHVAATVDRTKPFVTFYINGSPNQVAGTPTGSFNASNPALALLIGGAHQPATLPLQCDYMLDEVEIFKRALSQDEIKAIFVAGRAGKCRPMEDKCCEFALRLFNAQSNLVNKIRIIPVDPAKIIHIRHDDAQEDLEDDPEEPVSTEYTLQQIGSVYEITHTSGSIPADPNEMIDEEFIVKINSSTSLRVEWVAANGQVLKIEEIALNCDDPNWTQEEYPWESNTTTISGAQSNKVLFAGAERVECDPERTAPLVAACNFGSTITSCDQVNLTASVGGAATYEWDPPVTCQDSACSNAIYSLTGSGPRSIEITLTAKAPDLIDPSKTVDVCSSRRLITYCIPPPDDVDFDSSAPEAVCSGTTITGYKVTFTPKAPTCDVASYTWDFNDSSPLVSGTGNPSVEEHTYSNNVPGQYSVKLTLNYENGCSLLAKRRVSVDAVCNPKFKAAYEWCGDEDGLASVKILCDRQSNKFCQSTYHWDFDGAGYPANQQDQNPIVHTYTNVPPSGKQVKIKHKMIDADMCQTGVETQCDFTLNPIRNNLTVTPCADGNVVFDSSCPYSVKWSGIAGVEGNRGNRFTRNLPDGAYKIISECYDERSCGDNAIRGNCLRQQTFRVARKLCPIKEKNHADRKLGTRWYRMKYKFKAKYESFLQPLDPGGNWSRALVVSRTKLKMKKQGIFGIWHWRKAEAGQIIAGFEGTFRQDQVGISGCRGDASTTTNVPNCTSSTPTCDAQSNANKAKKRSTDTYLIHRDDSPVKSVHEVTIGSTVWRIELEKQANSCTVH
jgi:hypothetical protein